MFLLLFFSTLSLASDFSLINEWTIRTRLEHNFELRPQEKTTPLIVGDIIYFGNLNGEVYAVERKKGYILWQKKLDGSIEGALSYGKSRIIVGDSQGNLSNLAARNGELKWQFKAQGEWLSKPLIHGNMVFVLTSNEELFALELNTGKEIWRFASSGDEKMTIRGVASPVIFGHTLYQGFANGHIFAFDSANGKEIWSKNLRTRMHFYDIDSSPYVNNEYILVSTYDGRTYGLKRLTPDIEWVFPVGSYGDFLVENDIVYFSGLDGFFYSLNVNTGSVIWKIEYEKGIGLTPVRIGRYIAFTTSNDPFYIIEPKTGQIITKKYLGVGTLANVVTDNNWLYLFSNYGNLYAFRIMDRPFLAFTDLLFPVNFF